MDLRPDWSPMMDVMCRICKKRCFQVRLVEGLELHSKFITLISKSSCSWFSFKSLISQPQNKPGLKQLKRQKLMSKELQKLETRLNSKPNLKHRLKRKCSSKRHKLQLVLVWPTQKRTFWVCGNQSVSLAWTWREVQFTLSFHQISFHITVVAIHSSSSTLQHNL